MFYFDTHVLKSDFFDCDDIGHAFSTREGGISTLPHTKTMNLSFGLGDEDDTVRENMKLLCRYAGVSYSGLVGSAQYHTSLVRTIKSENALEGIEKDNNFPTDGFVTDEKGMSLIVRAADCTPILLFGRESDKSPVVGACHAGWRGAVGGIGAVAVNEMCVLGAERSTIKIAIGPCIHTCHFEVKDDFVDSVKSVAGTDFANKYVTSQKGKLFADLVGMNVEFLLQSGIKYENIDICNECTVCNSEKYHSHRATGGKRGTMGAVIGIK